MPSKPQDPKISVVMSAFNAAEYLDEAIVSILDQSFRDLEFIIVDDGSTDKTNEIITRYAEADPRVKLVTQKKNQGLITALNTGFKLARGKYIARMDADDISMRDRFLRQYAYMENHPEVAVLGTLAAFINEEGEVYGIEPFMLDDHEIRTEVSLRNRQFRHGAVLIRGTVVRENDELYDSSAVHYEDFEYWPRLLSHGKGINLPEVLYLYRKSRTSLTATKKPEMREGTERVMARERKRINLQPFRIKDAAAAFRTARTYKPASFIVRDKKLRSTLRWQYQSYLFALSKLYAKRKEYGSALLVMVTCFCINPARFIYAIAEVIIRSFLPA